MKLALDPTMFFGTVPLNDLPALVADLGYDYIEMAPNEQFMPFFLHPRVDRAKIFKSAVAAAGVQIASVLPLNRWSGPDEDERQAAVRY